ERLPGVGPELSHEVVPGVLPYSLDAALKQRQPELLALGRHSRNALMQALLGNLAQRYLRQVAEQRLHQRVAAQALLQRGVQA
ncbi:hypothetical protein ACV35S_33730, partial [Pseudomonas aeruginosa]